MSVGGTQLPGTLQKTFIIDPEDQHIFALPLTVINQQEFLANASSIIEDSPLRSTQEPLLNTLELDPLHYKFIDQQRKDELNRISGWVFYVAAQQQLFVHANWKDAICGKSIKFTQSPYMPSQSVEVYSLTDEAYEAMYEAWNVQARTKAAFQKAQKYQEAERQKANGASNCCSCTCCIL